MEKTEKSVPQPPFPALDELSLLPLKISNVPLHLLIAALIGVCSAVPVVVMVWGVSVENCSSAPVLFTAFLAILIQHALSRFAFPDYLEKNLSYGVATLLLIGQVLAAYLFFLNTAFFGSTAFVTAVLILIPVWGRIAMAWQLRKPNAWFYTVLVLLAGFYIFSRFEPALIGLPLEEFWGRAGFATLPGDFACALKVMLLPVAFLILTIMCCRYALCRMKDPVCAAMLTEQCAELAIWFSFLIVAKKLNFFF